MVLAVVALCGRAILRSGLFEPTFRFDRLDVAILALAEGGCSFRWSGRAAREDVRERRHSLSLMIWKYYAVFLIFRSTFDRLSKRGSVQTMAAASVVAVIAVFQSPASGVEAFLTKYTRRTASLRR
jgi:hypothetical protein